MGQQQTQKSITVFFSYAQADQAVRDQLAIHLSQLKRDGLIEEWSDQQILAGSDRVQAIDRALHSAHIILLLISADFLASDQTEMQYALERHRAGVARVIPIIVRPCDWRHSPFADLQCLPSNAKPITIWDNRDEAFASIAQELRRVIALQRFPNPPLSDIQRQNRLRLLKTVRVTWIEGLLEKPLHQAAWIDLHLRDQPDALANPWRLQVQELNQEPHALSMNTSIVQVYDEAHGELLILGQPGAGKTTLLLHLARTLLDRAEADERVPIPVVFNLSSWAELHQPLTAWLIAELHSKYQVPKQMAAQWIEANQILPLLDGLDEVSVEARMLCVQAITAYYTRHFSQIGTPLVICCRSQEYQALSLHLPLSCAVSILPLTEEQIDRYLSSAQGQLAGLRQALDNDAELVRLARRPLMLSTFTLAYQGATAKDFPAVSSSPEQTLHAIFSSYVERMLSRRRPLPSWTHKQFLHWLTFIAKQLHWHHQTVLLVEDLELDWLSPKQQSLYQWSARLVVGLVFGLVVGLLGGWYVEPLGGFSGLLAERFFGWPIGLIVRQHIGLVVGLPGGLLAGQVVGLLAEPTNSRPLETISWSWRKMRVGLVFGLLTGLVFGLLAGQLTGQVFVLHFGLDFGQDIVLHFGLALGLVFGLLGGLLGGLSGKSAERIRLSPNQGTWRSMKNSLWFGLVSGLVVGLVVGLVDRPVFGLVVGLVVGLEIWLFTGLRTFLHHFILRIFLWRRNSLPWNLISFLDEAAERLLLRKIGGGYVFVHRLLRDYFATLDTNSGIHDTSKRPRYTKKSGLRTLVQIGLIILIVIFSVVGVGIYVNQEAALMRAQATANNPYPSYLSGKGTLAFVDPLSQESQWSSLSSSGTGGACQFTGGAFHVREQQKDYFMNCPASGIFSNFTFEVQLTVTRGDCGGMTFRDGGSGHFYYFHICQNGSYRVSKYISNSGSDAKTLISSSSSVFHTGLGQQNKIAVVADGGTMTFYVNERRIAQVQDSSYTSGSVGLIADARDENTTDVAYTNAKLWTL